MNDARSVLSRRLVEHIGQTAEIDFLKMQQILLFCLVGTMAVRKLRSRMYAVDVHHSNQFLLLI